MTMRCYGDQVREQAEAERLERLESVGGYRDGRFRRPEDAAMGLTELWQARKRRRALEAAQVASGQPHEPQAERGRLGGILKGSKEWRDRENARARAKTAAKRAAKIAAQPPGTEFGPRGGLVRGTPAWQARRKVHEAARKARRQAARALEASTAAGSSTLPRRPDGHRWATEQDLRRRQARKAMRQAERTRPASYVATL